MSRYVRIYYGPCEEFYNLTYKPQKLKGMIDALNKLGYRVDLKPVEYKNNCQLVIRGNEVFRCNISNLCFNTPMSHDPVCARAIAAVQYATAKLERAETYFWIEYLIEDLVFKRSRFAPKEVWPISVDDSEVMDCGACCRNYQSDNCKQ